MEPCRTSKGRRYEEKEDILIEDPFLNDYSKLIQSKAYRRLAYKTQVLTLPDNPHIRTRLVHTNEVIALAMAIAEEFSLNIPLCMAIAAGHDLGHTPYGHLGEEVLSDLGKKPFKHNVNSVVIAQHVERSGKGLNLTHETLEGILYHAKGIHELSVDKNKPQEYAVVMFADKIAYVFSDLNDAIRYGYLKGDKIPNWVSDLGSNQRERTCKVIQALISESKQKECISFAEGSTFQNFEKLRKFLYEEVYFKIKRDLERTILISLYEYFSGCDQLKGTNPIFLISLLTDKEANYFGEILLKSKQPTIDQISHFGIFEIIPHIKDKEIDYTNLDLDWKNFYR